MLQTTSTPADLIITPRNRMFGRENAPTRWWCGENPAATAFYNSLSLTFPRGESFFIESVRHYRAGTPEPLNSQIGEFIKQEAVHTREHIYFNRQVKDAGYDLSEVEAASSKLVANKKARSPIVNLASTVAFEHFTAILAQAWLSEDRYFKHTSPDVRRLWQWHAMEEIEHKGVAFDTFLVATADMPARKRWRFRTLIMLAVTKRFLTARFKDMSLLLRQDGKNTFSVWAGAWFHLLVYPGLLRRVFPAWLAFFRPGFHPWDHDDRHLIETAEASLALAPPA